MFAKHVNLARELLSPFSRQTIQHPTGQGFMLEVIFLNGQAVNLWSLVEVCQWIEDNHGTAQRNEEGGRNYA